MQAVLQSFVFQLTAVGRAHDAVFFIQKPNEHLEELVVVIPNDIVMLPIEQSRCEA